MKMHSRRWPISSHLMSNNSYTWFVQEWKPVAHLLKVHFRNLPGKHGLIYRIGMAFLHVWNRAVVAGDEVFH